MITAVYPGSFDPPTCGHEDIIRRAAAIFAKLHVTVFTNPQKATFFSVNDRVDMLNHMVEGMDNVTVDSCQGLLVDYATERNAGIIVRGLRAVSDFDYEFTMALMNKKLASHIETVFIMTNPEYLYLSSSKVKELASLGANIGGLVPPYVETRLKDRFGYPQT
ncbi:MAG: pantetheine-phosphate adenylyltransferase [Bacillota bacterium]|jgi:pantetheine-phosphate adenylyltransferase|nr:pantetheine-phosphate adenylyltransferase [Bacillota bacterium]